MLFTAPSTTDVARSMVLGEAMHTLSSAVHYVDIATTTETGPVKMSVPLVVSLGQLEPGYSLVRPINATIRCLDTDNFVASFVGANINASGGSLHEAVSNLQSIIVDLFELLSNQSNLGPEPQHQLRLLRSIVRKNG